MKIRNVNDDCIFVFIPQSLRAVGVLFSPMVSGWVGGWKRFVRAVSLKLYGVGC